ncbi:hypothetical protein ACTXT7_016411 [Hymenolepis weldensis]
MDQEACPKEVQACCDVTTCKFRGGAECASGPCCDIQTVYGDPSKTTCKLKASGTVCRDVGNSCDLPEYCDGQSEWCPADVFKTDGEACYTKEGYRKRSSGVPIVEKQVVALCTGDDAVKVLVFEVSDYGFDVHPVIGTADRTR